MEQPPETPAGTPPPAAPTPGAQTGQGSRFSPDGFWWWDGAGWRPAYSQDRLWRWDGQAWVPAAGGTAPRSGGGGAGLAIGLTIGAFALVLILVFVVVLVILGTMGGQIANVFSNVAAALTSTPSP